MISTSRVAQWVRPGIDLVVAALGWIVVAPLVSVVRRKDDLVVFFGRDGGKYTDNCKHLFAQAHRVSGISCVFLARDVRLRDALRVMGCRAELVRSLRGLGLWVQAGTIVVDSIDWVLGARFPASRGAQVVQLWHGVPLKHVQLALFDARLKRAGWQTRSLLCIQRACTGRFARTSWFLSTSPLVTERAFAQSFRYGRVSHAGYPRNDVLFGPGSELAEFGVDAEAAGSVAAHRADNPAGLVGLYAPTFRKAMGDPFGAGKIELASISAAAARLGILLLIKLHPWMHGLAETRDHPGIRFVSPESDAYPLMREVDFLITDYSSIFFDFLLLDRPVLFFPYDLNRYLSEERPMYFDYMDMTPGPKAYTIGELVDAMSGLVAGQDDWKGERARVRSLVFEHQDGRAGERLLRELFPSIAVPTGTNADHAKHAEKVDS